MRHFIRDLLHDVEWVLPLGISLSYLVEYVRLGIVLCGTDPAEAVLGLPILTIGYYIHCLRTPI